MHCGGEEMKPALIYISIVGTALAVGTAGGIVAKRIMGGENIVYEGDASSITFDIDTAYEKYLNYSGNNLTKDFTPAEIVNIGLEKYRRCENSYSITTGLASTMVTQSIRNYQIKNGDRYFEESISMSSMVKLANRMYQQDKDGKITLYKGSAVNEELGSYSANGVEYEQDDYKNYLGKTLNEMFIYIITDSTILESEINENDGYEIKLKLDTEMAVIFYQYQMKNISGLDKYPKFDSVNLTFTFNENLELQHLYTDETYQATMGVTVDIHNMLDTYYYPNMELKIPEIDEPTDYSLIG